MKRRTTFIKKWKIFRDGIIKFGLTEGPAVTDVIKSFEDGDKDVCGLITLVHLLHRSTNKRKGKQTSSNRSNAVMHLLQNYPEGTDVEETVKNKDDQNRQPFLLALGPKKRPVQFFLVVDRIAICGGTDIVQAFDRLYKFHYVFLIDYSPVIFSFCKFVESMIYGITDPKDSSPVVRAMGGAIRDAMCSD